MSEVKYIKGTDECDYCCNRSVMVDYYRYTCHLCRRETLICRDCENRTRTPYNGEHFKNYHRSIDIV